MTYMTFQDFLTQFANTDACIDFILKSHDEGNVECTEYTIPYYTYNALANPPRFIAYADHHEQTHYFELCIDIPTTNETYYVKFERANANSMELFYKHLSRYLSDGYGEFERDQTNITDPNEMELAALRMQFALNIRRMHSDRRRMVEINDQLSPSQFIRWCRDLANLEDEQKATTERIEHLAYVVSQ